MPSPLLLPPWSCVKMKSAEEPTSIGCFASHVYNAGIISVSRWTVGADVAVVNVPYGSSSVCCVMCYSI